MLKRYLLRSPDGALAPTGGQTGASATPAPAGKAPFKFQELLAQREGGIEPAPNASQPGSPTEPPVASDVSSADPNAPGQTNLPPGQTPGDGGDNPTPGAPENEPPSDDPANEPPNADAELTAALAELSPKERASLLELRQALQPGEMPRIAQLIRDRTTANQTIESLQKEVEELKANGPATLNPQPSTLPPAVAQLKTVAEVDKRLADVQTSYDEIDSFLVGSPGDYVYQDDKGEDRTITRAQLVAQRKALAAELRALPQRKTELASRQQFDAARHRASAQARKDYPVLADAKHPDTVLSRKVIAHPALANEEHAEFLALAMATGIRVLQEQKAKAGNGNGNGNGNGSALKLPTPGIPRAKPHTAATTTAPRRGDDAGAAFSRLKQDRSPQAAAEFIARSGR